MNTEQDKLMRQHVFKALGAHFTWPNNDIVDLVMRMIKLREEQIFDDFIEVLKGLTANSKDKLPDPFHEGIYAVLGTVWLEFNRVMSKDVEIVWSPKIIEQLLELAKERG